jgi:hypothetical protein
MTPSRPSSRTRGFDVRDTRGVQVGDENEQTNVFGNYYAAAVPVSWPVRVGRGPLLADAFQARPVLRASIDAALTCRGSAVTQVVTGDGGTGKTQLVASVFRGALPGLDVAVWGSATSREAIVDAFAQARAATHPVSGDPGRGGERDAAAFLAWLETTDRAWMVVLDDVADPADVRGLWPTGPAGRVLVTTRRRDAALTGHGRMLLDVGVYARDEAIEFLTRKLAGSTIPGVLEQVGDLAADLGFLPLALAQAGAVILDEALTCGQYRRRFAERGRTLADLFDVDTGDDYERTVATTWALAIDRANAVPPPGLAERVLQLAAVLDPNGNPETVFTTPSALTYLTAATTAGSVPATLTTKSGTGGIVEVSAEQARRAMRTLHRLSLLTHDPKAGGRAVRMHALAQRAALEHLPDAVVAGAVAATADALLQAWPDVERDPDLGQALRANTSVLSGRHPTALWEPVAHAVLFTAGRSLGKAGQVVAARDYYTNLAATATERLGRDHLQTLTARGSLADWRGRAGDPAGAVAAFEQLLLDAVRVLGPDHQGTLIARASLAFWRGRAGDPAGAASAQAQLLVDAVRVLGPDHPDTLTARGNLADWKGQAGDPAGAAAALEELLIDRIRVLGPDHTGTLTARGHLARWQGEAGDPAGAVAALQQLRVDATQVLGPEHPGTLSIRGNLAHWRGEAGDPAGAVAALKELLVDALRVLGPEHPGILTIRGDLAQAQGQASDPTAAVAALEQVLADMMRTLGPDHPNTVATRLELTRWATARLDHTTRPDPDSDSDSDSDSEDN